MNRGAVILGLVAAVLVAGCVSPPQPDTPPPENESDDTTTTASTGVIQQSTLDTAQIYAGGSTRMILTLQNTRSEPLQAVTATIGNRGSLQFTRRVPERGSPRQHRCHYDRIPDGSTTDPATRRCIWSVQAPDNLVGAARESATFPLTAFVSYSSSVAPENSLRVSFRPQQDIAPRDRQRRSIHARNSDITVSFDHTSPVAAEAREIPLTITVRNVGAGTVLSGDQDRRGVTIRFGGTLGDAQWNMQETTCTDGQQKQKTVYFREGTQRAELSCSIVLAESNLAGKTFSLRPTVAYRYRVTQDTPIRITDPDQ